MTLIVTPIAPVSQLDPQHYSCHPRAAWEPLAPPLHQQLPSAKVVLVAPLVGPQPITTWAKWGFRLPVNRLTLSANSASTSSSVPSSVHAALINPNWHRVMEEEFATLIANNTWDLVPHPIGNNVITDKWIFMHKFNFDGSLEWYKARWVPHIFIQRICVDNDESFHRWSSWPWSTLCSPWSSPAPSQFISSM
jgi:hypothetical protein